MTAEKFGFSWIGTYKFANQEKDVFVSNSLSNGWELCPFDNNVSANDRLTSPSTPDLLELRKSILTSSSEQQLDLMKKHTVEFTRKGKTYSGLFVWAKSDFMSPNNQFPKTGIDLMKEGNDYSFLREDFTVAKKVCVCDVNACRNRTSDAK